MVIEGRTRWHLLKGLKETITRHCTAWGGGRNWQKSTPSHGWSFLCSWCILHGTGERVDATPPPRDWLLSELELRLKKTSVLLVT